MAGSVVMSLPVVFALLQRPFAAGLTAGATKG
jgi:ABC-type glycerol-3-phosphate transport system permease component